MGVEVEDTNQDAVEDQLFGSEETSQNNGLSDEDFNGDLMGDDIRKSSREPKLTCVMIKSVFLTRL